MSNIVADPYAVCDEESSGPEGPQTLVYDAILAMISPRNEVRRLLPHKVRRMVGAWCFVDVYGPDPVGDGPGMSVPPHPHLGLQTVSWLVQGHVVHRDSLGTTADVVPGRAALMTAGSGIAHAENSPPPSPTRPLLLQGVQLWVALPSSARGVAPAFALLPEPVSVRHGAVVVRTFMDREQAFTPLVGAELVAGRDPKVEAAAGVGAASGTVPAEAAYEHLAVALDGTVRVCGVDVRPGQAVYLGTGRTSLDVTLPPAGRALLLGGEPFEEEVVMWWNFVARTHEEVVAAREQWNSGGDPRFGEVSHYPDDVPGPSRLAAPELPNVRLRPRGRLR